ncbi:hypothetical protein D3C71_2165520 [compost metagenome]
MLGRVRAQLGVDVAVKDFYALDTLEALALWLAESSGSAGEDDFDLIFDALDELEAVEEQNNA